jgi:hypothetical protein
MLWINADLRMEPVHEAQDRVFRYLKIFTSDSITRWCGHPRLHLTTRLHKSIYTCF